MAIPGDDLERCAAEILTAAGVSAADARRVADCLVFADRRGTVTHGVMRLKHYVDRLEAGGVTRQPEVRVVREAPTTGLIDGDNGLGAVVATQAMEAALDKASEFGVGVVVARELNHIGAAAYYAMMAAERDMIGLAACNVPASMAPTGATRPMIGNNPLAIAFPGRAQPPIVWDAAMSRSSWGDLFVAQQTGQPLPADAFLGPDGAPTLDPEQVIAGGSLVPISGYKGYGLALCLALLTGVLADGRFDSDLVHPYRDLAARGETAALMIAIDVATFRPAEEFIAHVEAIGSAIRELPTNGVAERVWLPGEKEAAIEHERAQAGIPLADTTRIEIGELARTYGIDASCLEEPLPPFPARTES